MSTGIVGAMDPDGQGDLSTHYAVASTYSVHTGWPNRISCSCKRCGRKLAEGEGYQVVIAGLDGPRGSTAYFCVDCAVWVQTSVELVMQRRAKDATGGTPRGKIRKRSEKKED